MRTAAQRRTARAALCAWLGGVLGLATLTAAAPPATADTVSTATSHIPVRCSLLQSQTVQVDWYAPASAPLALVYLQHDWFDGGRQMRDLALAFTAAGYLVAVPSLPSLSWSCGLSDPGMLRAVSALIADGGLLAAGNEALGPAWPGSPDDLVLAGHGVGAAAVSTIAADPMLDGDVALVVHLDGRDTRAGLLHAALQADLDTPVLQLTAGTSRQLSSPAGTVPAPAVVDAFRPAGSFRPGVDGAEVRTGVHCDPEGGFPLEVCGSSARNQRAFFALAVAGTGDTLGLAGSSFETALRLFADTADQTPRRAGLPGGTSAPPPA
jgi:hypothetical protein